MADTKTNKPNTLGCLLIVIPIIGLVIGAGLWLGHRKDAAKSPCQRYADVVDRVLRNCHSGQNKGADHHMAICEQSLDPTPACLERLDTLTCDELERTPQVAARAACSRK